MGKETFHWQNWQSTEKLLEEHSMFYGNAYFTYRKIVYASRLSKITRAIFVQNENRQIDVNTLYAVQTLKYQNPKNRAEYLLSLTRWHTQVCN